MTARGIFVAAAVLAAAALATTALAASSATDPKTMVLQKADLPAGAKIIRTNKDPIAYAVTYRFRARSKQVALSSSVFVLPGRKLAVTFYRDSISANLKIQKEVNLPMYGDEQEAVFHPTTGGELVVRKGNIVWTLALKHALPSPALTRAEVTAELKRYGPKQMKRVGSG